jgi:hypothetical protein
MRAKTIGYIVVGISGAMKKDKHGVLWFGHAATVFPTRKSAQKAIATTDAYARKHGHTNRFWTERKIQRLYVEATNAL